MSKYVDGEIWSQILIYYYVKPWFYKEGARAACFAKILTHKGRYALHY